MAIDKREELKKLYNSNPTWVKRVNKMTDEQVVAIYLRLQNQNKI